MESHSTEITSPKVIYWVEMPTLLGEEESVEFLKRDILLKRISGKIDEFKQSINNSCTESAYFYNLDRIFHINSIRKENIRDFTISLIDSIKKSSGAKSLVHTNVIDPKIGRFFMEEGIPYIEKNLEDKLTAFQTTINLIKPLFAYNNEIMRSYIRINLLQMKYKAELIRRDNYQIKIPAIVKDISLNGIAFIVGDNNYLNYFSLKDQITIKIYIQHHIIKINTALVTRIDCEKYEFGVNFNINDTNMIGMTDADLLTKTIYKNLKEQLNDT